MELWISAASAVVALAALGLAVVEGRANRRHNRLSVLPRLRVDFDIHPDTRSAVIRLTNAGLGPAVFDSFEPLLDGQPAPGGAIDGMANAAYQAGLMGSCRVLTLLRDEVLTQGCSMELLCVGADAFDEHPAQDYVPVFRRTGVRIRYRSMYDEQFVYEAHGHQVFGAGDTPAAPA